MTTFTFTLVADVEPDEVDGILDAMHDLVCLDPTAAECRAHITSAIPELRQE